MTGHELRSRLRAARRGLEPTRRRLASEQLCARLLDLPELSGGGRVATYLPTDGEIDLSDAATPLRARGCSLYLPVLGEGRSMRFAPWAADGALRTNRYGIEEPAVHEALLVDASDLDVVLVPCVAADASGNRVGFGAGYYDRALAGGGPALVAVAYEDAVVESLTAHDWDVPMHVVVTERMVRRTGRTL